MKESAHFWHAPDIGDVELLRATYISHTFSRHTHPGYVIGMIERGVEMFDYRGRSHAALPGDVVVINPDEVHTGHSGDRCGWTYRMFYPSIAVMQAVAQGMGGRRGEMPFFKEAVIKDVALAEDIRSLHLMLEHSQSRLAREACFNDVMGRLILRHACNPPPVRRSGGERRAVEKARAFIDANLGETVSLGALSSHVGLSPFYLTRVFRRYTGLPPHAYQQQQRIRAAKQLLRARMSIAQVAAETGFSDQSHLTRQFKRIVGVTPGQYAVMK